MMIPGMAWGTKASWSRNLRATNRLRTTTREMTKENSTTAVEVTITRIIVFHMTVPIILVLKSCW